MASLLLIGSCMLTIEPSRADATVDRGGDDVFHGPLRARDLTPFGYLRLDLRPPFAGRATPGAWSIEADVAHQNTWALSEAAARYLQARASRRALDAFDLANIRSVAPESFLVDLELSQLDLLLYRQLSDDWGAFFVLSGVHYGGGLLDGVIEGFHEAFGMRSYGRPALPRGQINVYFDLTGVQYTALDAGPRTGLLDPTVGVRYSGIHMPRQWQLVLEAAAKVPLAGERAWLSTGRLDAGVQATLVRRSARHALFGNVALVRYAADTDRALQSEPQLLPTLVLGWEQHLTLRTHSIVQVYVSPSVYGSDVTQLDELRSTKYQVSLGFRHQRGPHLYTIAVTENLANLQNTPDVGLQLGWAFRQR